MNFKLELSPDDLNFVLNCVKQNAERVIGDLQQQAQAQAPKPQIPTEANDGPATFV